MSADTVQSMAINAPIQSVYSLTMKATLLSIFAGRERGLLLLLGMPMARKYIGATRIIAMTETEPPARGAAAMSEHLVPGIITNSLKPDGGLLSREPEHRHIYWSKGSPSVELEGRFSPNELRALADHMQSASAPEGRTVTEEK